MVITSESDAVLWASLQEKWLEQRQPGWIVVAGIHYQVLFSPSGEVQFNDKTNRSLIDSRSMIGSKSVSYNDLDD